MRRDQQGFTLIEIMVAVGLTGLLLGLILGIQQRMMVSFRGQNEVAAISETAYAATDLIASEVRQAGRAMPVDGVIFPIGGNMQRVLSIEVINGAEDDTIILRRADSDPTPAAVTYPLTAGPTVIDFTPSLAPAGIVAGDMLMLTDPNNLRGCVVFVTSTTANTLVADANSGGNPAAPTHCTDPTLAALSTGTHFASEFLATKFELDAGNPADGILGVYFPKISSGPVTQLGIGFSNLQFSIRRFEDPTSPEPTVAAAAAIDADGDGDPTTDWYSGDNQEDPVGSIRRGVPIAVGVSVESRNLVQLRQTASDGSPALGVVANINNNSLGNWAQQCTGNPVDPCGVNLAGTPMASRPARYQGEFVYRARSIVVPLRNVNRGQL